MKGTAALTVLYDPDCPLCRRRCNWLAAQPEYLPPDFLARGTAAAAERFPALNFGAGRPADDLIVVVDDGGPNGVDCAPQEVCR